MIIENAWFKDDDQAHVASFGFVPAAGALEDARELIARGTWIGLRDFATEGGRPVLAFGLLAPQPSPRVAPLLPSVDAEPFEQFLSEELSLERANARFKLDRADLLRIRILVWLARELAVPTSYWHHLGDNGLEYEYAWGFDRDGRISMKYFNFQEFAPPTDPPDRPRSALIAALWHVGGKSQNRHETDFPDEVRTFTGIPWNYPIGS